jgi:hypothetical protein
MLPDRYRQLLTAYVDGELTNRQRRHVLKLLRRSREARSLLRELQGDSQVLRALSRPRTPVPDITLPILETIAARQLRPGQASVVPTRPTGVSVWSALVAAAAVLLVIGVSSYFFFRSHFAPRTPRSEPPVVHVPPADKTAPTDQDPSPPHLADQPPPPDPRPEQPLDKDPVSQPIVKGFGGNDPPAPNNPAPDPVDPREPSGPVLTSPQMEMFKFEVVQVAPNVILNIDELEKDPGRKKLADALRKDKAYRVELPCRDGTRALHRLQGVWKAAHANLVIEATAQARLKRLDSRTNYVLYIHNVLPEELTELLRQLEMEDRKSKEPEQQFKAVVVRGMTKQDHKELSDLLGADPGPLVQGMGPLGTDPHRPIADDTANQIVRSLDGTRPEPGKPVVRPMEYQTLALSYNPVRPAKGAAEIKHFLDGRKPSRPGSVQVLLVLRGIGT